MNYRHVEVFFAVMTTGTVTEAARLLGVSQPSVTTTIKHAERGLGVGRLLREDCRLTPTTEARSLFEEAQRATALGVDHDNSRMAPAAIPYLLP